MAPLDSYDMSEFHFLVDDLQAYKVSNGCADYRDIAEFIEQTYNKRFGSGNLLWVCHELEKHCIMQHRVKLSTTKCHVRMS